MLRNDALQCTIVPVGMHIAQAKRNHTGKRSSAGGDQFPETQIMDQQNAPFLAGLLHNVTVW